MKKSITFKLIVSLIIVVISLNYIFATPAQADIGSIGDVIMKALEDVLTSVIGLFARVVSYIPFGLAVGIDAILAQIAYSDGPAKGAGNVDTNHLTPFDILFNKVQLLDTNFFDISTSSFDQASLAYQFRTGIAGWYYFMRMIAVSLLLIVVIYVGIRMLLSTIATERAMYKKMLMDWVASVLLVFLLNYIMIFTVTVSNAIVDGISITSNSKAITQTFESFSQTALGKDADMPEEGEEVDISGVDALTARILFVMLVFQTLGLLVVYFNRMLKLAFLTIVAPLITITYSIDKIGDGKAQALEAWLKEYVYTTLIQPFHCIIYMVFVTTAFNLIKIESPQVSNQQLAITVIAMVCLHFVTNAEKIVRKIFNFQNEDSDTSLASAVMMGGALAATTKNFGANLRNGINGFKDMRLSAQQAKASARIGLATANTYLFNKTIGRLTKKGKENDYSSYSLAETQSLARERLNERDAKRYMRKSGGGTINTNSAEFQNEVANIEKALPGIRKEEAQSMARRNLAQRRYNNTGSRRVISKVRGAAKATKAMLDDSMIAGAAKGLGKGVLVSGAGLFSLGATYGTGQSLGNAVGVAIAASATTAGFMKNSAKNASQRVAKNVALTGAKNQEQAAAAINKAMTRNMDDDESKEELEKIMKDVETALEKCGLNDGDDAKKVASNIRNVIKRGLQSAETPEDMQRIMDYAVSSTLQSRDADTISSEGLQSQADLRSSIGNLTDYLNDRQIFEAINSSEKVGISGDVMASMITGEFKSTGGMPAGDDVYVPKGFVPPKADPVKDYERGVEADTSSVADLKQRIEDVKERENDAIESAMIEMEFQADENPNFYGNAETMEEKAKTMAEKVQEEAKKQLRESGLVEEQSKLEDQLRKQYEKMVDDAEAYFGEMEAYAQKIKEVDEDYEKRITELRTELENMRQNPDASKTMIQDVELVVQKLEGERRENGERAKQVKESFAQYASGDQFAGVREAYANDGRGNTPSFSDKQTTIDNMQSDMDRIVKRSKV